MTHSVQDMKVQSLLESTVPPLRMWHIIRQSQFFIYQDGIAILRGSDNSDLTGLETSKIRNPQF